MKFANEDLAFTRELLPLSVAGEKLRKTSDMNLFHFLKYTLKFYSASKKETIYCFDRCVLHISV